jgi:hypothetical protein
MTMVTKILLVAAGAAVILSQGAVAHADQYPTDLLAWTVVTQSTTDGGGEHYPVFADPANGAVRTEYFSDNSICGGNTRDIPLTGFWHEGG